MTPGSPSPAAPRPVHNRIGVVGAWLADVLFFLFGRPAFLFPLMLALAAWGLQRRIQTEASSRANTLVRIAGFVLVLVASCALTTLHWQPGGLRQSAGGVVGTLVGDGLAAGLDFLGATLLMIAAWMAGLSLAFGVSWFTIMDRLGSARLGGGRLAAGALGILARDAAEGRERRQARKEAVRDRAEEVGDARAAAHRAARNRSWRRARAWSANARCRCSTRPRRTSCRR